MLIIRTLLVFLLATTLQQVDRADARSIRDLACPSTILGKYGPMSRNTDRWMGFMEFHPEKFVFSKLGEFPFKTRIGSNDKEYYALSTPMGGEMEGVRFLAIYTPTRYWTGHPSKKCFLELVECETEEDMIKNIKRDLSNLCSGSTYLPIDLYQELLAE